jgi:hypothetical protein
MVGTRSGSLVGLGVRVAWDPFIGDLCNIAIVMVCCILDVLRATIRKSNWVGASHGVPIRCLSSIEGSLGVIISNSVLIGIGLRSIFRLLVGRARVVRCRFGVVGSWSVRGRLVSRGVDYNRGRLICRIRSWMMVDRGWFMVGRVRCMVGCRCMVWGRCRLIGGWGRMIGFRSRMVWGWSRMIWNRCWSRMVGGRGWMIGCRDWCIWGVNREGSWGMNLGYWFLIPTISMDRLKAWLNNCRIVYFMYLWSSMGLAGDWGMNSTVGLVHWDTDGWGISLFEHLVMCLVTGHKAQQPT